LGDDRRAHQFLPAVYDELRRLAAGYLRRPSDDRTLQPTVLVHEAFLKVQAMRRLDVKSRTHLVALAAVAMRQILVDHVRTRRALKRGGGWSRVTLDTSVITEQPAGGTQIERVEEALERLEQLDPEEARIVELKFFGGLTEAEIADEMSRSVRWVRQHWAHARGWMRREISANR
jgi:RNA polymerase sigma-70 factor (ECF subfamily)